jgi:hypothetical protein
VSSFRSRLRHSHPPCSALPTKRVLIRNFSFAIRTPPHKFAAHSIPFKLRVNGFWLREIALSFSRRADALRKVALR